ncbi:OsmC family protein [Paenibacillus hexagrammi]|uniref:OsmC family protein n=1 Tax=Paenibacillus hexagrammi TaxID=2908839 RepID=A0ABY3SD48_9BACL|nr:OsmC family protein [Paenibacillus sp. YPD9-1]UJF31919.1 OsmC family protein [Paenibacillus sp. YPD9-1]
MPNQQHFELKANWQGGLQGSGQLEAGGLTAAISVPVPLGGPGIGTNPEELLLGAAATCYLITLGTLLQRQGIESVQLKSEIFVSTGTSMHVHKIIHRPVVTFPSFFSSEQRDKLRKAAIRAEQTCMISKALRGNVEVIVEPELLLADSSE